LVTTAGKDNLTRQEARDRAGVVAGASYEIVLDLSQGGTTFSSETTVRFDASPGASTFIDLDAVEIQEVELNGRTIPASPTPEGRITLDGLEASNVLRVKADCAYSRTGTGLHRLVDPVDKKAYAYTQFEPFDAHRVFACFDQPDIKATFAFSVDVAEEDVVVSNTVVTERPEPGKGGRWVFRPSPVMSTYLAALCVGPFLGWKRAELWPALQQLRIAFFVAVVAAIVAAVAIDSRSTLAAVAFGFGVWLIMGSLVEFAGRLRLGRAPWSESLRRLRATPRASLGMTISHAALGVVVLGAVATGAWHLEVIETLKPGERTRIASYDVTLVRVDNVQGPNYVAERAILAVAVGGRPFTILEPERRLFTVQRRQVAETAIHSNGLRDLYAALGEGDRNTGWVVRLYLNPLAPWIWLGAALCAFGGFVSLSDRRLRIGAPSRRPAVQAAE
jgi:hypothetical protein